MTLERDLARNYEGPKSRQPKILFVDLENTPGLGWFWPPGYETTILDIEKDPVLLCFSYKWGHQKRIHNVSLPDFQGYTQTRFNIDDREVVHKLWDLFNEADVIIAQNGDNFDCKVANTRFLKYGLNPPAEYKTVDTLKVARSYFKFSFNSLDHLCRFLGIERKVDAGGKGTWFRCMDGSEKDWKHIIYYNNADVDRLMKVYERMRGWIKNHPVMNLYTRKLNHCPVCMSNEIAKNGTKLLKTGWKQKWSCKNCGKPFATKLIREEVKIDITL
jgi:hypothetical protein